MSLIGLTRPRVRCNIPLNEEIGTDMAVLPEKATIELKFTAPPAEYFHEGTMAKVFDALIKSGLDRNQALDGLTEMQNAGILFRERFKI